MSSDLILIRNVLSELITVYQNAIELIDKEREHLIKVDSDKLIDVIEQKQVLANRIKESEGQLKKILTRNGVNTINEFLFFASEKNFVDDIRVLNGKLKFILDKFRLKSDINKMIAQEHVEFFTGLLNIYASFFSNANYDKDAKTNIEAQIMSVRV